MFEAFTAILVVLSVGIFAAHALDAFGREYRARHAWEVACRPLGDTRLSAERAKAGRIFTGRVCHSNLLRPSLMTAFYHLEIIAIARAGLGFHRTAPSTGSVFSNAQGSCS